MAMPPAESREFVIQCGIAANILSGFAVGFFTLRKWTFIWLGLLVVLYVFWMLDGFPQITGGSFLPQIIPINFTYDMTYVVNRSTKFLMYLTYLTLFPPLRRADNGLAD